MCSIVGFAAGQPPPPERKALLPPEDKGPPTGLPPGPPRPMGMPGMMPFARPPLMPGMGPNFPTPAGCRPFPCAASATSHSSLSSKLGTDVFSHDDTYMRVSEPIETHW